jgi:hypothetical protein
MGARPDFGDDEEGRDALDEEEEEEEEEEEDSDEGEGDGNVHPHEVNEDGEARAPPGTPVGERA